MRFGDRLREHVHDFFSNLDQPAMPAAEKWTKLVRNRAKSVVSRQGCCGHPGEPGC